MVWRTTLLAIVFHGLLLREVSSKKTFEDWVLENRAPVSGLWQVAEVEYYSKADCSGKPLSLLPGSGYSNTMNLQKVWDEKPRSPVKHAGKDCVEECGGKSGYCDWCGVGNACCRKGFAGDPPECENARDYKASKGHQCVAIVGEHMHWVPVAQRVSDSDLSTVLDVPCFEEACASGNLFIGAMLPHSVQCLRVLSPKARRGPTGTALNAWKAVRDEECPGECRSGAFGGGKIRLDGICSEILSKSGQCGHGREFSEDGVDCSGCGTMKNLSSWQPQPMLVVHREWMHKEGQEVMVSQLRLPSKYSVPLKNAGEDCSEHCAGGFCLWCGEGNACCRQNSPTDPPECSGGIGFVRRGEPECVRLYDVEAEGFPKEPMPFWSLIAMAVPAWIAAVGLLCFLTRRCFWPSKKEQDNKPKQLSGDLYAPQRRESHTRRYSREEKMEMERLQQEVTKLEFLA